MADESIVVGPARHKIVRSSIDVLYDGERVDEPRIVSLAIVNTGKKEVVANDYSKPLTIAVPGSKILDAIVTGVSDPGVHDLVSIRPMDGDFRTPAFFEPLLLNPGDWIVLQLIVSGIEGKPDVSVRFAGQSRPMKNIRERQRAWQRRQAMAPFIILTIAAALTIVVYQGAGSDSDYISGIYLVAALLLSGLSFVNYLFSKRRGPG